MRDADCDDDKIANEAWCRHDEAAPTSPRAPSGICWAFFLRRAAFRSACNDETP
jgi:hypothetical protein